MGVDTRLPLHNGTGTLVVTEAPCDQEQELFYVLGSPTHCYPDMCCVWEYYDVHMQMYCEEEWCEYGNEYDCSWEPQYLECWY